MKIALWVIVIVLCVYQAIVTLKTVGKFRAFAEKIDDQMANISATLAEKIRLQADLTERVEKIEERLDDEIGSERKMNDNFYKGLNNLMNYNGEEQNDE